MSRSIGRPSPSWNTQSSYHVNPSATFQAASTLNTPYLPANAVYYANWKVYRGEPPSSLNIGFISHVFYAFAWPNPDGTISLSDEYADTEIEVDGTQGCISALTNMRKRFPQLKIILSVGGAGQGSLSYALIARNDVTRLIFARSAKLLVDMYGFDGIDIDWEHPSNSREGADYISLLAALRSFLPAPQYILSSALPAGEWALRHINMGMATSFLDLINLMAYDFSGPWTDTSGHHAQLFSPSGPVSDARRTSCDSTVKYLISKGVPARIILLGIPLYGRSFLGATGTGQSYIGHAGDEGTFDYKDLPRPKSQERVDTDLGAAFCVNNTGGFITYDNPQTVQMKANYAVLQGLGGVFYWTGTSDQRGSRSLVETGYNTLHNL